MSEQGNEAVETWRVVTDGSTYEFTVRLDGFYWYAERNGVTGPASGWAGAAVTRLAAECHMGIVEVLAPGEPTRAQLRAVASAAAALVLWHDANTPDGDLNDADGHFWSMIVALRAAGYEMPTGTPTGPSREEMVAEIAHLEARRGALLAEVDRLTAAHKEAAASALSAIRRAFAIRDVVAATLEAAATRFTRTGDRGAELCIADVAAEVRALNVPESPAPQPIVWGAMPTPEAVAAHAAKRSNRIAPWMRRYSDANDDFVEVVYLNAADGRVLYRRPDGAVWYIAHGPMLTSKWRPITDDGGVAT